MKILFRPEAEDELIEAIDWYEFRCPGLGADMLRCVDACIERISRHPESYPVVHRETRMALVRRFPYLMLYRISDMGLSIIAVFHASRDPKIWQER